MGTAIPHAEILVIGDDGAVTADGAEGELVHCGPLVAQGLDDVVVLRTERLRQVTVDPARRIARAEGVFEEPRLRDQIALLEVEVVALEMMVLRVLSAEKSGKQSLDVAGLLKIRGSEIQQRYTELMMLAGGPYSRAFVSEAMEAAASLFSTMFTPRLLICGSSVSRSRDLMRRNSTASSMLAPLNCTCGKMMLCSFFATGLSRVVQTGVTV